MIDNAPVEHGTVKAWLEDRGFGFITDSAGEDLFVHANQLPGHVQRGSAPLLKPGQEVRFVRFDDPRGPKAVRVEPVAADAVPAVAFTEDALRQALFGYVPDDQADNVVAAIRDKGWLI